MLLGAFRGVVGNFDFRMRVSKAGHGNDRVWKAEKPAFHPSHTLWKSLWDSHIPTTSTAGIYLKTVRKHSSRVKFKASTAAKGLVTDVPGPKCNGRSGTLSPQPRSGFRIHTAKACQSMGRRCGRNTSHLSEQPVFRPLAKEIDCFEYLNKCIGEDNRPIFLTA
jgi:hypothetical protein